MAAPGERLSIVVNVTPRRTMHLYAPGKHDYQVVQLTIDPQPWLRAHDTVYPPSEIYHFKPLDERVEVYSKPFRLTRDVTLLATPEAQKQLGGDVVGDHHRRARVPGLRRQGLFQPRACAGHLHGVTQAAGPAPAGTVNVTFGAGRSPARDRSPRIAPAARSPVANPSIGQTAIGHCRP